MTADISDAAALTVLAEHGMTGADAETALRAWRQAPAGHPDAARVQAVFRAAGLA